MSFFRRTVDPELEAARAAAQREQARFELDRARVEAQIAREQQEAQAEFARRQAIADEQERRRRDTVRRAERAERRARQRTARAEFTAKLRPVLPLLLINGGAAYAQAAYAFEEIAPAEWNTPSKLAFAVAFAVALESIAVYVQWHAHDALMLKAHGTATSLRRASWGVAGLVAAINYAHFAGPGGAPTAAAVAFALLSLLSPWLWGLHTRRAQHVQLLAEDASLIDESGVEFSPQRRRAFPIRSWQAKRWSIDHYETDPRRAWEGYNADRLAREAAHPATAEPRKPSPLLLVAGLACTVLGFAAPGFLYGAATYAAVALNTAFVLLWLWAPRKAKAQTKRPDELTALVDATAPTVPELVEQAVTRHLADLPEPSSPPRPRWRPAVAPRSRRIATPRPPEVTVVVAEPATPAATRLGRRWHPPTTVRSRHLRDTVTRRMSHGRADSGRDTTRRQVSPSKPAAGDTDRDTVTRRVSRSKASGPRQSTADRVAAAVAKNPAVKPDALAKKFGVSTRTIQRAWPKPTATVNGHNHSEEQR
ncbi:hypothetical protein ACFUYE_30155 [Micromonospora humida]|uniref:hypothetical protein n=1 Tax=Micromonospora humida TaxID=2809018 RepID=UPI0036724A31